MSKIVACNEEIKSIYYSGYTITKVYACGGELVYSLEPSFFIRNKYLSGGTIIDYEVSCEEEWGEVYCTDTKIYSEVCDPDSYLIESVMGDCATGIDENAYAECYSLSSVTFGENITTIGARAFRTDRKLKSVNLPSKVTTIGDYAFSDCSGLTRVTVNSVIPPTLGADVFLRTSSWLKIYVPCSSYEDYLVEWSQYKDRINPIGGIACNVKASLQYSATTELIYGEKQSITSAETYQGSTIKEVSAITVYSGVTTIGDNAFIKYRANKITLAKTITSIGNDAFYINDSPDIQTVILSSTTPPTVTSTSFKNQGSNFVIKIPNGSLEAYVNAPVWKDYYLDYIEGYVTPHQISYIERTSQKNGYINLNVGLTNVNRIVINYQCTSFNGDLVYTSDNKMKVNLEGQLYPYFNYSLNGDSFRVMASSSSSWGRLEHTHRIGNFYIQENDGTDIGHGSTQGEFSIGNLVVFGSNGCYAKIKSIKIYEWPYGESSILHNFVPYRKYDNTVTMYDTIGGNYATIVGTLKGSDE